MVWSGRERERIERTGWVSGMELVLLSSFFGQGVVQEQLLTQTWWVAVKYFNT
jgi:hypothetical protein